MLPEGSHLHYEDLTYFILNRELETSENEIEMDFKAKKLKMVGTVFLFGDEGWRPVAGALKVVL